MYWLSSPSLTSSGKSAKSQLSVDNAGEGSGVFTGVGVSVGVDMVVGVSVGVGEVVDVGVSVAVAVTVGVKVVVAVAVFVAVCVGVCVGEDRASHAAQQKINAIRILLLNIGVLRFPTMRLIIL